jgi:lysophospholipase L1-like esterase
MNDFRTTVSIHPSKSKIDLKTPVFTLGSCFSDVIGFDLDRYKIPVRVNPFGVIYNPSSIHTALGYALRNQSPEDSLYVEDHGIHVNYDFHSELSSVSKAELTSRVASTIDGAHTFLKKTKWLIITYGTAWIYQLTKTGRVVANCHKQPAGEFEKRLMTPDEIVRSFGDLHREVTTRNPNIRIILTVSPVRHIKDTLELNQVSKSILRMACHEITNAFDRVEYFPSFEIMMDDLRDYRFYKSDMIHPSDDAEKYIWQKFGERYFTDETKKWMENFTKLLTALAHKPFHPNSEGHQRFLKETLHKLENLQNTINVDKEIAIVKKQLI